LRKQRRSTVRHSPRGDSGCVPLHTTEQGHTEKTSKGLGCQTGAQGKRGMGGEGDDQEVLVLVRHGQRLWGASIVQIR